MERVLVDQAQITTTHREDLAPEPLEDGAARLRMRRFALTSNNVTYAATGFQIGYWKFFPSGQEGQGIVPVWGYADTVESRSDALATGTRLYGFFPMAEELVIRPGPAGERVVFDGALHRADLPPVYNRYTIVGEKSAQAEAVQALLQPLLATSWLLADWLQDSGFFLAEQVIVGSASSKTGLGLCAYLAELDPRPVRIIGLTSPSNFSFVEELGTCDAVLSYDAIADLPQVASVYVDMSGNAEVKQRLHSHLGDHLRHSSAVGISHWDQFNPKLDLAGPKPEFFFAPARIEQRRADWGPGVVEGKIGDAVRSLAGGADAWLDLREHQGLEAAEATYRTLARGEANPRDGHVVTL